MTLHSHQVAELGWEMREIQHVAEAFERVFHRLPSPIEMELFRRALARTASRRADQQS